MAWVGTFGAILAGVLGVMGLLAVLNRTYVKPYSTALGQLVLLLVVALLAAGLLWLRNLAADRRTERFLVLGDGAAFDAEVAS